MLQNLNGLVNKVLRDIRQHRWNTVSFGEYRKINPKTTKLSRRFEIVPYSASYGQTNPGDSVGPGGTEGATLAPGTAAQRGKHYPPGSLSTGQRPARCPRRWTGAGPTGDGDARGRWPHGPGATAGSVGTGGPADLTAGKRKKVEGVGMRSKRGYVVRWPPQAGRPEPGRMAGRGTRPVGRGPLTDRRPGTAQPRLCAWVGASYDPKGRMRGWGVLLFWGELPSEARHVRVGRKMGFFYWFKNIGRTAHMINQ